MRQHVWFAACVVVAMSAVVLATAQQQGAGVRKRVVALEGGRIVRDKVKGAYADEV